MTDSNAASPSAASARRGLFLFLVAIPPLVALPLLLRWRFGGSAHPAIDFAFVAVLEWVPAAAAIFALSRTGGTRAELALGPPREHARSSLLTALLAPLAVAAFSYGLAWQIGLAPFTAPAGFPGAESLHPLLALARSVMAHLLRGGPAWLMLALGEEIGWRGYLAPKLEQARVARPLLVGGLIWSAWHWPSVLGGIYPAGPSRVVSAVALTVTLTSFGAVMARMRMKSGSIWPAVIAHAIWNSLFFDSLEGATRASTWWTRETGIFTALASLALAMIAVRRGRRRVAGAGAVLVLFAMAGCRGPSRVQRSDLDETAVKLPALSAPVRVLTDSAGIPHVEAASLSDLYFAWGWVTARDRLWQLVLSRARGRGELHLWLGNSALRGDGGAQLFELRERAAAIWARDRRDSELRAELERYAAGINAYLGECRAGTRPWPPEIERLGIRPRDWSPEDSELILLGLGVTLDLDLPELDETEEIARAGAMAFAQRHRFEARRIFDTIPDSLAAATSHERVSKVASSAPNDVRDDSPWPRRDLRALAAAAASDWPSRAADGSDRASNEMVVGAARSASGAPMLANDPHLAFATPGPLHVIHVFVPGLCDAAGAAVPGLPAVVSGRNRSCAWGVTALSADVIDVYADSLSADGRKVKTTNGWIAVRTAGFALRYRLLGLSIPVPWQVRRYTPHGPVLKWDRARRVALSARWSAMENSRVSMARMVGVERSRTAAEIAERFRTLVTPTINLVAADVGGHTLYQTVGLVPRRPVDPGPGVLAGDGRHEWPGFIAADSMPAWNVPANGFAVNGNNRPERLGTPYSWPRFDWIQDRAARMAEDLGALRRVSAADLRSIQNDVYSRASARATPLLLARVAPEPGANSPRVRAAIDSLEKWDDVMRRDQVAPTLARAWWNAFVRRTGLEDVPGLAYAVLAGEAAMPPPSGRPAELTDDAARASLETALDTLTAKLGGDPTAWTWGRAHRARFAHALASLSAADRARFEPETIPMDGDGSTVAVGPTRAPWNFNVVHGPAFRHVVDLADTSQSWVIVAPWNSAAAAMMGSDLREAWADHRYVPLRLGWHAIERTARWSTTLRP